MKKKNLLLMITATLLASCIGNEDLYDPNKVKEDAKANFPVKNIDPTQDWATRGTRTLDVTVNEETGKTYTIKVFTANPLVDNTDARLLTETEVKNGSTTNLTFDVSLALDYVYVMCKAGEKDYSVSAAPLVGNKFTASFGKAVGTRAYDLGDPVSFKRNMTVIDPMAVNVIEGMAIGQIVAMGAVHTIGENFTLNSATDLIYMGTHLYVSGTLKAKSLSLSAGSAISILEGGKLELDETLSIMGGEFYNAGTVTVGNTMVASRILPFDPESNSYGKFQNVNAYANSRMFTVEGGSVAQNDCKLNTQNLSILINRVFQVPVLATFNNGGYVECSMLNLDNSNLNLSGKSILSAKEASLAGGVITGPASGPNYPLFMSPKAIAATSSVVNTVYVDANSDNAFLKQGFKSVKVLTTDTENCTPEYTTDQDPSGDISLSGCTIGFEDVNQRSTTDYDFNDVVLWVSNVDNEGFSHIYLVAAGATNKIKVGYTTNGGRTAYLFEGKEVHELLNISEKAMFNTSGDMIMTGLPVQHLQVAQPTLDGINFFIEVNGDSQNRIYSKNSKEYVGGVPFALCVSEDWAFPAEKKRIDEAYPKFGTWGANKETEKTWYKEGANDVRPFDSSKLNK